MQTLILALVEPSKTGSPYYAYYATALAVAFIALIAYVSIVLLKKAKRSTDEDEKEVEELFARNNVPKGFFDKVDATLIPELTTAINSQLESIEKNIPLKKTCTPAIRSSIETLKNKFHAISNHFANAHLPVTRTLRELLFIRLKLKEVESMAS